MMKRKIFLFTLLFPFLTFAQRKATYKVGKPYNFLETETLYQLQNAEKTQTLTIKYDKNHYHFQKFSNKSGAEIRKIKIKRTEIVPFGAYIIDFCRVGDKIFCFTARYQKQKILVQYREFDFKTCRFLTERKMLLDIGQGDFPSSSNIECAFSLDKSKIMFCWRNWGKSYEDSPAYEAFSFHVFNTALEKLEGGRVLLPYPTDKIDVWQLLLHSNGTPYVLAAVYGDDPENVKDLKGKKIIANYHYELFQIDLGAKAVLRTKLDLENTLITHLYMSEGSENSIFCSGFYTNRTAKNLDFLGIKISSASADGLCLFRVDDIGMLVNETKIEIPDDIVHQYKGIADKSDNNSELSNLRMRYISTQEDGSKIIIAEQMYTRNINHFDDVLICKVNDKEELLWMKKLPKRQNGGSADGTSDVSFSYQNLNNNHYIIFLDHVKNVNLSIDQKPVPHTSGKGGYLTYYKIKDGSGAVSKESVFSTYRAAVGRKKLHYRLHFFRAKDVIKTSESSFMMEFYKKFQKDVMVRVKVN